MIFKEKLSNRILCLPLLFIIILLFSVIFTASAVLNANEKESPTDPFDPNFCGGQWIYPFIGINFATVCGPRNQVALGFKGKFMWLFPSPDGIGTAYKGEKELSREELADLVMKAEAVMLADIPSPPTAEKIIYNMGMEFHGRSIKGFFTTLNTKYSPAGELYQNMLKHIPAGEVPALPECGMKLVFDPVLDQSVRIQILDDLARVKKAGKSEEKLLEALRGNAFSTIGIK